MSLKSHSGPTFGLTMMMMTMMMMTVMMMIMMLMMMMVTMIMMITNQNQRIGGIGSGIHIFDG